MPEYATGPGRHGRGPVIAAYAETGAIDCHCPNCHAQPGDWCTHAEGLRADTVIIEAYADIPDDFMKTIRQ